MTATADVHRGGGGWLLAIVLVVGFLAVASLALEVDTLSPDVQNIPVPQAPNAHAVEKHIEAQDIYARYQSGQYSCLRVYRQVQLNRMLWLFTYSGEEPWGGMFTTVSGAPVTAFVALPEYWIKVICRDGYVLMSWSGRCPPEVGCR